MLKKYSGFTIVELMIVVAILVVLGLLAIITLNPRAQLNKAYDAHRRQDLIKIQTAIEGYYADKGHYPTFDVDINGNSTYTCGTGTLVPYLSSMPCDPTTKKPYVIVLLPLHSQIPSRFVVYAHVDSLSDPYANKIPQCPQTIAVKSPDVTNAELIGGCSSFVHCATYYGCVALDDCESISNDFVPVCEESYCDDNTCGQHGVGEICPASARLCLP